MQLSVESCFHTLSHLFSDCRFIIKNVTYERVNGDLDLMREWCQFEVV